jgi:hypothetical protein
MRKVITTLTALGFLLLAGGIFAYSDLGGQRAGPDSQNSESATESWQTYENDRFGYQLDISSSYSSGSAPTNNDGRTFTAASGSFSVEVFARNNSTQMSFDAVLSEETQDLESMNDADIASTSATLYGENEKGRVGKRVIYRPNKIGVVTVSGSSESVSSSTRARILESFQWTDQPSEAGTSTTPNQRPVSYTPDEAENLIRVDTPTQEQTISSPLEISGEARGQWLFEADAPVVLTDWDGRIIAEGYISAEGSWMTDDFVPFSGTLEFSTPEDTGPQSVRGSLIIQRANPSGQPENDMAVEMPVRFQR